MYRSTQTHTWRILRSRAAPSAASGSPASSTLGSADVKYQCSGSVPHSALLNMHALPQTLITAPRPALIPWRALPKLGVLCNHPQPFTGTCHSYEAIGRTTPSHVHAHFSRSSSYTLPSKAHLFSAVLNQSTSPSGQSQRPQNMESSMTVSARLPATEAAPTMSPLLRLICLANSMCRPINPAHGSKSHLRITCRQHASPHATARWALHCSHIELTQTYKNNAWLSREAITGCTG